MYCDLHRISESGTALDKTCVITSNNWLRQQDYFDEYIAHLIQKPAEPNSVAILLRGGKKTKKSCWQDFIMKKLFFNSNKYFVLQIPIIFTATCLVKKDIASTS